MPAASRRSVARHSSVQEPVHGRSEYMSTNLHDRVGLAFTPNEDALSSIDLIRRADQAGVSTVWLIMPANGLDIMSIFAAALPQTEQIRVGTAILPAFTRHPITTANQV